MSESCGCEECEYCGSLLAESCGYWDDGHVFCDSKCRIDWENDIENRSKI